MLLVRKRQLLEAFVYERSIDRATYNEQLEKLDEAIALAEIDLREAALNKLT
jgi:hypothetical protein